jgi:hypothetical protein
MCVCVRSCVRACVRARVCVCMYVGNEILLTNRTHTYKILYYVYVKRFNHSNFNYIYNNKMNEYLCVKTYMIYVLLTIAETVKKFIINS